MQRRSLMENNVLSQGISEIYVIKDMIAELNDSKEQRDSLETEEKKAEKNIAIKEKSVQDEVTSTIKKRRDEIEIAYNDQLEKTKIKIKKIKSQKEKSKSVKVKQRIELETADLSGAYDLLQQKKKEKIKENKLPSLCNLDLFYTLYMPKFVSDFVRITLILIVLLYAIPCGIYFFLLPVQKIVYMVVLYIGIVVVFGSIYMLIERNVKDKYSPILKELQILRGQIRENVKEQRKMKRAILKDKDESPYELNNFDEAIETLNVELNSVEKEKADALTTFDQQTKEVISNEIKGRHEEEITALKTGLSAMIEDKKHVEEKIKRISLHLANTYEVYIGKEMMTPDKLERLATIMKEKELSTISEGLADFAGEGNGVK